MKKKWTPPKLTVLSKGMPEESVLDACKWSSGGGPHTGDIDQCFSFDYYNPTVCTNLSCYDRASS